MVFLPDLSAQETKTWLEDGPWRKPKSNLKAKTIPEPDVLYSLRSS
jgi:hypothetical protein